MYSIATLVGFARQALLSSTSAKNRTAGAALGRAEVVGIRPSIEKGRQVTLTLGFYRQEDFDVMDSQGDTRKAAEHSLSLALGGWEHAVHMECKLIGSPEGAWQRPTHPATSPAEDLNRRLDRFVPPDQREGKHILARRWRYELGVDHAKTNQVSVVLWRSPSTQHWERLLLEGQRESDLKQALKKLRNELVLPLTEASKARGTEVHDVDWSNRPFEEWGDIDCHTDKVRVGTLGPSSKRAETHEDVKRTLEIAEDFLEFFRVDGLGSEREVDQPLRIYTDRLLRIARDVAEGDEQLDVLVVYRGGGIGSPEEKRAKKIEVGDQERFCVAVESLVAKGVEVVVGIGHGTVKVLPKEVFGAHEAITPTAAARWVVAEHADARLLRGLPDKGQKV